MYQRWPTMHEKIYQRPQSSPKVTKIRLLSSLLAIGLGILLSNVGWAYEALPGFTGNHLTGTVTLKGKIPAPRRFNLALFSDPYYCGRVSDGKGWRIAPKPRLSPHNRLPGAVVFLKNVKKGKPSSSVSEIIQTKNCIFLPYVAATQVGQPFHFQNWDPVQHKLELFLTSQNGAQLLFGQNLQPHPNSRKSHFLSADKIGLHQSGPNIRYQYERSGILVFRCKLHDYMEGWSVILPHPYYSLTGGKGEFSITNIPPGTYQLVVWHPLGEQETTITIGAKEGHDVNILLIPTSLTTYPEEDTGKNPFGIDLVGDPNIVPTVEVQK